MFLEVYICTYMNQIVHIFTCKVELPSVLTGSYELL